MNIMLVQPPQGDPAQPYTSLAALVGAWRCQGLSVMPDDLNLAFFNYLCRRATLAEHMEIARRKLSAKTMVEGEEKTALRRAIAMEEMLATGIERAIGVLRNGEEFYEPSLYAWAIRFISRYLEAVSAPYYPGKVTMQSFSTRYSHLSSREILQAAEDQATNPFIRFCEEELAERYRRQAPDIVALSVTFQTQLIPAFTFAHYVKKWLPGTRVVMGGAALARCKKQLLRAPHLFRDVDATILYEGETAFPALMAEWEQGRDGLKAPNVMLLKKGAMKLSLLRHVEDLSLLPPPDHDGLALDDYWWPEPALLYNCARGCYWGKCAFCQISPATVGKGRGQYRIMPAEKIISDLEHIHRQTGAVSFNLAVDALPPKALMEIGEAVQNSGLPITWDTEIRLENSLTAKVLRSMSEGGCRHLRFGFESASQRVLDLMNKGTRVEHARRIIDDCRDAGITISLMCQSGFPGETYEESTETVDFLKNSKDRVAFLSIIPYVLESGSKVFKDPDKYGVEVYPNPENEDLSWMFNYVGPEGRGVNENYAFFGEVEKALDENYPDRDLFFKGGLGHAHTSLYVRRYPYEKFITWSRAPLRAAPPFREDRLLRAGGPMVIMPEEERRDGSGWSKFIVALPMTPECLFAISGSALLVLASCTRPLRADAVAEWIRALSANNFTREEALTMVRDFYENGLLLAETGDTRTDTIFT